ncbi:MULTISPECIES: taurine ABC transporter substrate-binding protein [Pseudofrankia]|uniref:taurine ABC transporter substrate-binding protein n=1 Tax=Pseudofrankia TaxID=2994363 RepID=UPI000315C8DF|nr:MULTISPECIES: ABC transporter substrate-binding protein [Pseudofrankia]
MRLRPGRFGHESGRRAGRRWLAAPAAAVLAVTLAAAACSSDDDGSSAGASAGATGAAANAPKQIRIAYQAIPNGDLVVKHEKWLEAAFPNTKITWTKFDSGGDVNTAVIAGSVDLGLAGSSPVTRGLSAPLNIPYQVVWIHDVIGAAESLVARNGAGITSIKDLAGKKIATPFASTSHYSLLAALKLAGVDPASVKLVDLEPPDIQAAWARGDIDAAYVWSPTLDELKKNGTVLTDSSKIAAAGYPTFDLGVATKKFVGAYPDVVAEWLRQEDKAVKLLASDPAKASADIGAELNLSPDEALAQTKGLVFLTGDQQRGADYFGTPQAPGKFADGLLGAAEFLKSQDKIDAVPTLETLRAGLAVDSLDHAFAG